MQLCNFMQPCQFFSSSFLFPFSKATLPPWPPLLLASFFIKSARHTSQLPSLPCFPSPLTYIPSPSVSPYHHVVLSLVLPLPPNCVLYGLYCAPLQLCLLPCISFRLIILLPITSYFLVTSFASPSPNFLTIFFFCIDLSTALPTLPCPPFATSPFYPLRSPASCFS